MKTQYKDKNKQTIHVLGYEFQLSNSNSKGFAQLDVLLELGLQASLFLDKLRTTSPHDGTPFL